MRAGCGIWLYQFLIIAYLFTLTITDVNLKRMHQLICLWRLCSVFINFSLKQSVQKTKSCTFFRKCCCFFNFQTLSVKSTLNDSLSQLLLEVVTLNWLENCCLARRVCANLIWPKLPKIVYWKENCQWSSHRNSVHSARMRQEHLVAWPQFAMKISREQRVCGIIVYEINSSFYVV